MAKCHYIAILGLNLKPMAQKRHLWYTNLTPVYVEGSIKFLCEEGVLPHVLNKHTKFELSLSESKGVKPIHYSALPQREQSEPWVKLVRVLLKPL